LTQRPIVFAFPDIAEYRQRRGLNLEPYEEWAPGPFVYDLPSLAQRLSTFREGNDPFVDRRFEMLGRFHRYADADSGNRLLNLLAL
jgi:CDP-glycerol glycerophosphotransferase (TagB/SpsB family)